MEGFGFPFIARFNTDGTFGMTGQRKGTDGPVSQEMSGTYTQKGTDVELQVTRYAYTDHLGTRSKPIAPMQGHLSNDGQMLTVRYGTSEDAFQGGYVFHRSGPPGSGPGA